MKDEDPKERIIRKYYGYSRTAWYRSLTDNDKAKLRADYYFDISPKSREALQARKADG